MRGRWIDTMSVGDVIIRSGRVIVVALVVALAACSSTPGQSEGSPPVGSTVAPPPSTTSTTSASAFPVATFAAISEDPVSEELAAKFQDALALHEVADGGGMSATVMTAEGSVVDDIGAMAGPLVIAARPD